MVSGVVFHIRGNGVIAKYSWYYNYGTNYVGTYRYNFYNKQILNTN